MSIVQKRTASAKAKQPPDAQLAKQIQEQLGISFKKTDGKPRGRCPACDEEDGLYIDRLRDDDFGYTCSACGISGFTADDLAVEQRANDPDYDGEDVLDSSESCDLEPERIQALKELAAEHFHANLTDDGNEVRFEQDDGWITAIDYLVEKRGHSLDTLNRFRVGLSLYEMHDHAIENGFSYPEQIAAGLLRPSYCHYWNEGLLLFPHIKDGEVSHFSQKDVLGEFTHQAKKEHRDPECLWYNQDASTNAEQVVCVEGENDVLSVAGKAGYDNVIGSNGTVSNDQIEFLTKLSSLKRLILCFDNDSNGRRYTRKVAKKFRECGSSVEVVKITLPQACQDIDDFLREADDPEESFKQLLDKASIVPNPSIEMDEERCRCLHDGKAISNFIIEIVYRVRTGGGCERYVRFRNQAGKTSDVFQMDAKAMASPGEFKKFCLDKGDFLFTGPQKALDDLWEFHFDQDGGNEVFEPSHVGYIAGHDCWLLGNVAVKVGRVYEADDYGIIWIGDEGFRPKDAMIGSGKDAKETTFAASRMTVLGDCESNELIERTLDLFKKNLDYRGYLVIGWIYAVLHAEEIYDRFQMFPGLFLYGKLQSGKDVLAGWIMSFFGLPRTVSQNFSETTQVAVNRLFAMFSCMPVWLDEFRHTDLKARWKYAFLRGVFNRTGAGKGVKDDPAAIRSVAIRGVPLLSGEQLPGDPALRSRYVRILLSGSQRDDNVYEEIEQLSDQFSAITMHWLRNKTSENTQDLIESIARYRRMFIEEHGWDARTAEVYSAAIAGFLAIRQDDDFVAWAIKYVAEDRDNRDQESVLTKFFEDLNSLLSQGKLNC